MGEDEEEVDEDEADVEEVKKLEAVKAVERCFSGKAMRVLCIRNRSLMLLGNELLKPLENKIVIVGIGWEWFKGILL